MATSLEDPIMEERTHKMLPLTSAPDTRPTLRTAHFLKPSGQTALSHFPPLSLSSSSTPLKVTFNAWRNPQKDWNTWLHQMHLLHKSTWFKSGIHDAIMNSTFTINKIEPLVLGFTERWCSETNTFVFPFGEATITLEDVMILGGYSVLGESVVETTEFEEIYEKLEQARIELVRTSAHNATHTKWMEKFIGSGSKFEHAAFLVLWLSRFVFPSPSKFTINKNVIPIASRLSQGCKIALAPAVLAAIYRDLSLLKIAIVDRKLSINLSAIFQLVQVWIWERFPSIRPNPNLVDDGEPRFARWHNRNKTMDIESVRLALESGSDCFQWRPYCKDINRNIEEGWVSYDCNAEELVEYTRIFRASELVGLECIEQYLPHRTAMQFGFDQDLPGHVARANENPKIAWRNYTRTVVDKKLYFPPRCFEADVTTRYFKWWNKGFGCESTRDNAECTSDKKRENDALVPPGFCAKTGDAEAGVSFDEDQQTVEEFMRKRQIENGKKTIMAEPLQSSVSSSSPANEFVQNVETSVLKNEVKIEHVVEDLEKNASNATENGGSVISGNREGSVLDIIDLKARVIKLEKDVARIKAEWAKQNCKRIR